MPVARRLTSKTPRGDDEEEEGEGEEGGEDDMEMDDTEGAGDDKKVPQPGAPAHDPDVMAH
jgi:histone chaperone ASF1